MTTPTSDTKIFSLNPASFAAPVARGSSAGKTPARSSEKPDPDRIAHMILTAMDAAAEGRLIKGITYDRRHDYHRRRRYRVKGTLRLFSDPVDCEPYTLYLRDVEPRALGFVSPDRLPLGYAGNAAVPLPDGSPLVVEVTVTRCRECYGGWFEGAMYFARSQDGFAHAIDATA